MDKHFICEFCQRLVGGDAANVHQTTCEVLRQILEQPPDQVGPTERCELCGMDVPTNEYSDHIFCHTLDQEAPESQYREPEGFPSPRLPVPSPGFGEFTIEELQSSNGIPPWISDFPFLYDLMPPQIQRRFQQARREHDLLNFLESASLRRAVPRARHRGRRAAQRQNWPEAVPYAGEANEECTICLNYLRKGVKVWVLSCTHTFHKKCIMDWAKQQPDCPLCRTPI